VILLAGLVLVGRRKKFNGFLLKDILTSAYLLIYRDFRQNIKNNLFEGKLLYSPKICATPEETKLDTLESNPLFAQFINAIAEDALTHPEKLHDVKKVWDKEWKRLLKHIIVDDD